MRDSSWTDGDTVAGRYRLVQHIGSGGMGSVWEGEDLKLGRRVAVKLVAARTQRNSHVFKRFVREATLVARMKSPHVVVVHDFGFENRYPYIVMELLIGEALSKRLAREGCVAIGEAQRWARQIGKALTVAHAMGVVHRDLKPSNIIIVSDGDGDGDGDGEILKVIDFGIAKALGGERITSQMLGQDVVLGTPSYMSPEQVSGGEVDARSDLWAFGVLLYRALTGRKPFSGEELGDVLVAISRHPATPATKVRPGLPHELDAFMARALAKDPDDRFQSAKDLVDAFRALGSGTPATAVESANLNAAPAGRPLADEGAATRRDLLPAEAPTVTAVTAARTTTPMTGRKAHAIGDDRAETEKVSRPRGHRLARVALVALLLGAGGALASVLICSTRSAHIAEPLSTANPPGGDVPPSVTTGSGPHSGARPPETQRPQSGSKPDLPDGDAPTLASRAPALPSKAGAPTASASAERLALPQVVVPTPSKPAASSAHEDLFPQPW